MTERRLIIRDLIKVYMTDFFLFARSILSDMLISERKVFFSKPFFFAEF